MFKFAMGNKIVVFSVLILCCLCVGGENATVSTETDSVISTTEAQVDLKALRQKLDNQSKEFEKSVKTLIKGIVKRILPTLMSYNNDSPMSTKCMGSIMKYISGLTSAKVWAMKMLDATSKPPSGILDGTFSDFGGFDGCLDVQAPSRNGKTIEFKGKYCAIEARPKLLPIPKNFSMAKQVYAKLNDGIGEEARIAGMSFYYLKFRLGACVPSTCTLEDMQGVAKQVAKRIDMEVQIPQCYVKEDVVFKPIHIVVIFLMSLLLAACIAGSVIEYKSKKISLQNKDLSRSQQIMTCFSLISNYQRLMSASKGSEQLKALHGLRGISLAWVILGHSYVWMNFQLLRTPSHLVFWFNNFTMGCILNGWMAVETFFLLSGLLTSYAAMRILPQTKGRVNVPLYILRRYIRLTPPLLLAIGVMFFMPLLSSGPFWYERVDPEIKSCSNYWWRSILYISNWFGMHNICMHPTWYLSADFQLHLVTVIFLLTLYRWPKLTLSIMSALILACSVMVAVLTYLWDLPPIILISSGNDKKIQDTVNVVHLNTFTHAGPYYVGFITGYLIHKYKNIKMTKKFVTCGWAMSTLLCLTSVYGAYKWNKGEPHELLLTSIYAGLHRTTFSVGVAWVAFACVTGHGGLVNRILSSAVLAPLSRLTFMIYLIHSLVIWVRMGSLRERVYYSHYNLLYEYVGNFVFSFLLTIPFYLLLEAPLSNLERLVFSKATDTKDGGLRQNGHLQSNLTHATEKISKMQPDDTIIPVELMSVKHLENGCRHSSYNGDLKNHKHY